MIQEIKNLIHLTRSQTFDGEPQHIKMLLDKNSVDFKYKHINIAKNVMHDMHG